MRQVAVEEKYVLLYCTTVLLQKLLYSMPRPRHAAAAAASNTSPGDMIYAIY